MSIDVLADELDDAMPRSTPRPVTRARWAREMGYIEVTNLITGEVCEIPVRQATPVWKRDLDEIRKHRGSGRD